MIEMAAATRSIPPRKERATAIMACFLGLLGGHPSVLVATATIFFIPLTQAFGWGRTIPSLMHVASMIGIAFASIWIGRTIERFGVVRVVVGSSFLLTAIFILLAGQSGSAVYAVMLCLLGGVVGAGTNLGVYMTILPRWFDDRLGRALGLAIIGISAGAIVMPMIATTFVASYGWQTAYYALAAAHLSLSLVVAGMLKWLSDRERRPAPLHGAGQKSNDVSGSSLAEAIRTRGFWITAATIFLASLSIFGMMAHVFPLYIDRGIDQGMLPLVVIGMASGTLIGRVTSGFLLDFIEARIIAMCIFAMGATGVLWLAYAGPGISAITAIGPAFLIGIALGAETDIIPYIVRRVFGLLHYPVIYNRLLVPHYFGAIAGTLLLGWAHDNLAEPRLAVVCMGASCIAACGLAIMLPSTRKSLQA